MKQISRQIARMTAQEFLDSPGDAAFWCSDDDMHFALGSYDGSVTAFNRYTGDLAIVYRETPGWFCEHDVIGTCFCWQYGWVAGK